MSLHVMPGDTVKMEVYAKYLEKAKTKDAVTNMASIVGAAFGVTDAGEAPQVANAVKEALATGQAGLFAKDETIPKAYLNYLFFDKDMNYKSGGFQQVTEDALGNFEDLKLDYVPGRRRLHDDLHRQPDLRKPECLLRRHGRNPYSRPNYKNR